MSYLIARSQAGARKNHVCLTYQILAYSTFSEKGDQLQNRDIIFFFGIFGPVFS